MSAFVGCLVCTVYKNMDRQNKKSIKVNWNVGYSLPHGRKQKSGRKKI